MNADILLKLNIYVFTKVSNRNVMNVYAEKYFKLLEKVNGLLKKLYEEAMDDTPTVPK